MTDLDYNRIQSLIGDTLPGGGAPAAWWLSTDADIIQLFDDWADADTVHHNKIADLAKELGCTQWMGGRRRHALLGFIPPSGMTKWESHPDYRPIPEGWRIDSKSRWLVPSRRTKKDRESEANTRFSELRRAPQLSTPGMPQDLWLPGYIYGVDIRRGDSCVMAFCGGDPDRTSRNEFTVDETKWERLPLSIFHRLREEAAA